MLIISKWKGAAGEPALPPGLRFGASLRWKPRFYLAICATISSLR